MKFVSASEFKAQCLRLMDQVQRGKQSLIVTKNRKPIVQINPITGDDRDEDLFDCMRGDGSIVGDIESAPLDADDWDIQA